MAVYSIYSFDTIDSTNSFLINNYNNYPDYSVIYAEEQTSGRGRFNRIWNSIKGKDCTFSILLPVKEIDPSLHPVISQITAFSVYETLKAYSLKSEIKWPNDVIVNNKKICGIICEKTGSADKPFVVIGIGININSSADELSKIDQPATSIYNELNVCLDINMFMNKILENFFFNYFIFKTEGFEKYSSQLNAILAYKGLYKYLIQGNIQYKCQILYCNMDGSLCVKLENGIIKNFYSGEISYLKD